MSLKIFSFMISDTFKTLPLFLIIAYKKLQFLNFFVIIMQFLSFFIFFQYYLTIHPLFAQDAVFFKFGIIFHKKFHRFHLGNIDTENGSIKIK